MKLPDPHSQAIVREKILTAAELKQLKETFEVREWDASGASSKDEILEQIGALWGFPSYFGHNWDALVDCLSDLTWIPAKRFAFVIRGGTTGKNWDTLLECLTDVSARWKEQGKDAGFVTVLVWNQDGS